MARWALGVSLLWVLACAGPSRPTPPEVAPAAPPPSVQPWSAFEGEWVLAEMVEGKPALLEVCSRDPYYWLQGDTIHVEWPSGEGGEYPILGSHQDGEWLVLETKEGGSFRIKRDGPALVWDKPVSQRMYPKGADLPRFVECCTEDEADPMPTGEIVPAGAPCKGPK